MSVMRGDAIAQWLAERPRMVLDGAMATELERRGADLNDPLWSARVLVEQPELIRQVHLAYFQAGADVATTASYQASFEGFARRGIDPGQAERLMRLSVELAVQARDEFWSAYQASAEARTLPARKRPLVAASVGPFGAMLADGSEYRGYEGVTEADLRAFHRPRLRVLAQAGADLLACETIPCLAEARALAALLEELPQGVAWMSFSCKDGRHTSQGEPWGDCVEALEGFSSVAAIGVNCTAPRHIPELLATARARTGKPIVVYPNAGEHYDPVSKQWSGDQGCGHGSFADQALGWARGQVRLIGGCCRTTPADIAELARRWEPAPTSL